MPKNAVIIPLFFINYHKCRCKFSEKSLIITIFAFKNRRLWLPSVSQPQAEEGADTPFDVVQREALFVAVVGEIEYHRHTDELVAPLVNNGTTPSDDNFWEVVMKGNTCVTESH